MGDPSDPAPEVEDLCARRNRVVNALGLPGRREQEVELNRAAVRRSGQRSSAARRDAFIYAIASIVIIGFTPEALGNNEPSMT